MGWDDGIEDLWLVRAQNLPVESLEITSLGMSQIFGPSWIYHIAVDDLPLLKLCHGPWAKVGQIGSDQNWWISSNMITEMGCWSPMTSISSYSSKGWLNHQITLMASCRGAIGQLLGCRMETNQLEISASITKISSFFKSTNQNKSKQIKIEKMSEVWFPSNSSNFRFRWISCPMWQRWRRCWSRSALWDRRRPGRCSWTCPVWHP